MTKILIDLPDTTLAAARRQAQAASTTRKAWIEAVVSRAVGNAENEVVLGVWQVAGGELDTFTCADCGSELAATVSAMYYGVTTSNRIVGPLCVLCARAD